jgi:hypothetical protein
MAPNIPVNRPSFLAPKPPPGHPGWQSNKRLDPGAENSGKRASTDRLLDPTSVANKSGVTACTLEIGVEFAQIRTNFPGGP